MYQLALLHLAEERVGTAAREHQQMQDAKKSRLAAAVKRRG